MQLDARHRQSLREFRFGPFPADGADDQLAIDIPHIFPNLHKCTLEAQALTFPSATVVETIDRFLAYNSVRGSPGVVARAEQQRCLPSSQVTLCMSIYYQHVEVLEKVLGRIVREKGCKVRRRLLPRILTCLTLLLASCHYDTPCR